MTASTTSATDLDYLRRAIAQSRLARRSGNKPYGAVFVSAAGVVLHEAHNSQITERDVTGHAELNLLREASRTLGPAALAGGTVYASGEPCLMCAGSIYWSGAARVVFALSVATMNRLDPADADASLPSCRGELEGRQRPIRVFGPMLEDEAETAFFDR